MNLGGEVLASELAKLIDDEMLKEDCKNLSEFNRMKDNKLFIVLNEVLQEFIDSEKCNYEEILAVYKYYGKILDRLKGDRVCE
jgi:hypothetical protein